MKIKTLKLWGMRVGVAVLTFGLVGLIALANQFAGFALNVPTDLSLITNATLTATDAAPFWIPGNTGITITVTTTAVQSSNVQPVTVGFDVTADRTNWTTYQPYRVINTNNGTANVTGMLQLTADQLRGVQGIRQGLISQASATAASVVTINGGYFY